MASTNKTTHYDLSQYIGTDKPTYLTDYNQDMAKIDAGINDAKSEADTNAVNIGSLENLNTTSKSNLVSAVNEINSKESDLETSVGDNTSDIGELQGNIGNKANLNTTDKSNLVSAINEVNTKASDNDTNIGDLNTLNTSAKNNLVSAINEIVTHLELTNYDAATNFTCSAVGYNLVNPSISVATNTDGSFAKMYGSISVEYSTPNYSAQVSFQTSLRPTTNLTVNGGLIVAIKNNNGVVTYVTTQSYTISTTGLVTFSPIAQDGTSRSTECIFTNSLLFVKDFGDTPTPNNRKK